MKFNWLWGNINSRLPSLYESPIESAQVDIERYNKCKKGFIIDYIFLYELTVFFTVLLII